MEHAVYVPAPGHRTRIDAGSGIVATPDPTGRLLTDYEGNRGNAVNMRTWADRIHHAAGRHEVSYPTIARSLLPAEHLIHIGHFDSETGNVDLGTAAVDEPEARALAAAWCGTTEHELDNQLRTAGSAKHTMLREVTQALASGDPARIHAARHMARRYNLPV